MKKGIIAILSVLYLASTAGATIHLHYCMNKLVSQGLGQSDAKKCGKCGMEKKDSDNKDCCKDEHKQVRLDNDHKITENFLLQQLILPAVALPGFNWAATSLPSVTERYPISHSPPGEGQLAVYIRHCVFRI